MGRPIDQERRNMALWARTQGWTFDQIGEALGTSRQAASQLHKRALKSLKTKRKKNRRRR